jgi:hypothetical protein
MRDCGEMQHERGGNVAALKECPNCATDIRADAVVCPICKYEFPRRGALPWKPVAALVLLALLVPLVYLVVRSLGR